MTDKPEAVAWLYEIPGANHRYAYAQRRDYFAEGWTETPLYAHPPSQPDASALVEALAIIAASADDDDGWTSDGHERCTERAQQALTAWEAQHG